MTFVRMTLVKQTDKYPIRNEFFEVSIRALVTLTPFLETFKVNETND